MPKLTAVAFWSSALTLLLGAQRLPAVNDVTIDGSLADWADELCAGDTACDDFPNQQDAKGACIASNHATVQPATTAYLRFDFDDTSTTGANTLDACWLVDSDQNGNADVALCFSLNGDPVVLTATNFFTCNDSSPSTCGNPIQVVTSEVCAASNSVAGGEKLLDCSDGPDTAVECSILLSDIGWSSGSVVLLRSCSSTSAQPNSATFDCIIDGSTPWVVDPEGGGNSTPVELLSFSVE